MSNRTGSVNVITPRSHALINTDPVDVLVQWKGGERQVINNVTHAYLTTDGRVTFMSGRKATRMSIVGSHRGYRAGSVEYCLNDLGGMDFHAFNVLATIYTGPARY